MGIAMHIFNGIRLQSPILCIAFRWFLPLCPLSWHQQEQRDDAQFLLFTILQKKKLIFSFICMCLLCFHVITLTMFVNCSYILNLKKCTHTHAHAHARTDQRKRKKNERTISWTCSPFIFIAVRLERDKKNILFFWHCLCVIEIWNVFGDLTSNIITMNAMLNSVEQFTSWLHFTHSYFFIFMHNTISFSYILPNRIVFFPYQIEI